MRSAGTEGDFSRPNMASLTTRERRLLGLLRGRGPLPRADIARLMDLPGPAVFRATEDLARLGLVEIGPGVIQGRGQPSALVSLCGGAFLSAGLAVMSDRAEAVLMDLSGAIVGADDVSAPGMRCDAITDNLQAFITYTCSKRGISPNRVGAVGVAVAGYFVDYGSTLNTPAELDDWALVELRPRIAERLGRPVYIENVARAAAVGEAILGVGRSAPSFAYLNIAAGLGCGIIIDGELMRGRWGNAGEIGALPERLGAVKPTLERLREILAENSVSTDGIGGMLAAYRPGWPGLEQWVAEAAPALSSLILILQYVLDLDAVVIGGRLPPDLAHRLAEAITWLDDDRSARRGKPLPRPRIVVAELTSQSAAVGAASVPLKRLFFSPAASTEAA